MAKPVFSLIYTSVRADRIEPVLADWVSKCWLDRIEIILAVDGNDPACQAVAKSLQDKYAKHPGLFKWCIQPDEPFCCVTGWNLAAEKSSGSVLIQVTDDMVPPMDWDLKLLQLKPEDWVHSDHAVHVEDGYVHNIMVLAIITRARYERYGYFFYPDYLSLFSDTELTAVAYRDGVVIDAKHLLFEHMHPDCKKRDRDSVDLKHASQERWHNGEALFNLRKSKNFPVDVGPMAGKTETSAPKPLKFAVYIQATKNDFCLQEVCARMMEEGAQDFFFSVPDEYWSGRPTPESDIQQIVDVCHWCTIQGAQAQMRVHKVASYRFSGDTRLRVETRVRNDALAWIRKHGFEHILIVDGDELWKRGTLEIVRRIIEEHHPAAISTFMTPVIGLPGFPVQGATDVAVVYIGGNLPFQECRTPIGAQFRVHMPLIYHFTGTRRTMDEILRKHRESGHYDDPQYAFEEWLTKVLPNIRPGFTHDWGKHRGLHFYLPYQIWPSVRPWHAEDAQEIPVSLHPFLGLDKA